MSNQEGNQNDQHPKFVNRKLQKKMRQEQKLQKQQEQGNQDGNKGQPKKENNKQQQQQNQGGGQGNQRQQNHGKGSQQQNQRQSNQQDQNKSESNQNNSPAAPPSEPAVSGISSLFSHIQAVHKWSSKELLEQIRPQDRALIHPSLIEFALQTAQDISLDEDERTRKFLLMMKRQISDEPAVLRELFRQALFNLLKRTMTLLTCIRLNTIGIGNSVRFIKKQLSSEVIMETEELRSTLMEALDYFIEDKINDVADFLSKTTANTIVDGDVIMTYGYSPIICKALKIAADNKIKFRVIVVDSRPNFDSRTLVEQISDLDVRYVLISGLSYVMPEVKKVLIEPNGILSNNAAQTPIGTAMISMVAHECGVPVIFVCGSYRFVSDVRIDALSKNERISDELLQPVPCQNMKTDAEYLALIYDVTPGQYVDVVMSELGNIPVNSISTNIKFIQDSYTMFSKKKTATSPTKK